MGEGRQRTVVTSFVFRVRNVPAALYKALGGFATNGVNMTKLESYMVEGEFTATQFLADVEAHPDEPALSRALEELAFFARNGRFSASIRRIPIGSKVKRASGLVSESVHQLCGIVRHRSCQCDRT